MDYHSMDITKLKLIAKERRIKLYYIKRKAELIEILSFKELPFKFIIEKKTIHELRDEARLRGIENLMKLNRQGLVDILYPSLKC
jgi:hypothetical protein